MQYIIYHELGHLFGYRLARKNPQTDLEEVVKFEVGQTRNCVSTSKPYYQLNLLDSKDEILANTSKIERTLAWFIAVIAGCTMQCCFEKKRFNFCFQNGQTGQHDFRSLSVIRPLSSFTWTFDDIFQLQNEFENIIQKHHIISVLEPIVIDVEANIINTSEKQICLENQALKGLVEKIDRLIKPVIIDDYLNLVNKFKAKYN